MANAGDAGALDDWAEKIPWRRVWQPTLVFLPGKSHGQKSLVGYSPWGPKRVEHNLVTKQQQSFGMNSSFVVTLLHLNS